MTRNTVIGARRRKTSGKISAATNHRLGRGAVRSTNQPEHSTNSPDGEHQVDQGGVAAVEGPQPLPDAPGAVVLLLPRRGGLCVDPCAPGPEPLGVQVT